MRQKTISAVIGCSFFVLSCGQASLDAAQTNNIQAPQLSRTTIKTNFIEGARLSTSELKQVLALAKECGIAEPTEVRTFCYLPSVAKGISVKGVEKVDGRTTSFETILINKIEWYAADPDKAVRRNGNFWADASGKYTTLLRVYEFRKKSIQISIGKGIDITFAEKVIPLIESKKIRFENDQVRREVEKLGDSKPVAIYQSYSDKGYELRFNEPSMRAIMFKLEKGQVVISGVAYINI